MIYFLDSFFRTSCHICHDLTETMTVAQQLFMSFLLLKVKEFAVIQG